MRLLDVPVRENDAGAATVGDYLVALLVAVWREQDGFSGKRPFGNSSWTYDIYLALADAGVMKAERDVYDEGGPDEYVDYDFDYDERTRIDKLILGTIRGLYVSEDG